MSNFFRDSSIGFKPRSNIFSKLRVKEPESHNGDSSTEADSSLMDDLFAQSHPNQSNNQSSVTVIGHSDGKQGQAELQLASSTPRVTRTIKTMGDNYIDEDELEITEVRGLLMGDKTSSAGKGREEKVESGFANRINHKKDKVSLPFSANSLLGEREQQAADTSSNDVLLEAFNNTQKICSNLKQELQRQQTENSKLKSQIQVYQVDKEGILQKFSELKKLLNGLNERSRTLLDQKSSSDSALDELKGDYGKLKKKIDAYKSDIAELKVSITSFQSLKKDSDAELSKRSKEIDYLTRELNDCSGLLSEERLKNCSLVQEIGNLKTDFKESLSSHLNEKQGEINNRLKILEANLIQNITEGLSLQLLKTGEDSYKKVAEQFSATQEILTSVVQESTSGNSTSIIKELNNLHKLSIKCIDKSFENSQNESKRTFGQQISTQNDILKKQLEECKSELQGLVCGNGEKTSGKVEALGDVLKLSIDGSSGKVSDQIKTLSESFTSYRKELMKCQEYESKLHDFESEISTLNLQKGQALSSLGVKEAQYEELSKKAGLQDAEMRKYKEIELELRAKVDTSIQEINALKNKWIKLNEDNITLKANSENKIIVQGEILKTLQSENETLKQKCEQLDGMRQQFESRNSSHNDKVQRINEQLQKLNVEMVQLKAHELELEEENRKLKSQIDDSRFNYEEATDEFKRLRQKVIVLEAEKQDSVREKIDLQDKNDELQSSIKTLKQKLNLVHKNELPIQKQQEVAKNEDELQLEEQLAFDTRESVKKDNRKLDKRSHDHGEGDEFDLSSSLNDDLELTNPSPIQIKPLKTKRGKTKSMKPPNCSRKKLLLPDEDESSQLKHRWKKRRS